MNAPAAASRVLVKVIASIAATVTLLYLGVTAWHTTLRPEVIVIAAAFNLCFVLGRGWQRLALATLPLVIFALVYDAMRLFPNYLVAPVDVAGLYRIERQWFGVTVGEAVLIPSEYFARLDVPALDLLAGFFYLNWIAVPVLVGFWLYARDTSLFLRYSWCFLITNLIGFAVYYLHPAAPPWYVTKHGFTAILGTPGDPAGLARFDALVHREIFTTLYTRNSNVFAALPSLHCAYPVVAWLYARMARRRAVILVMGTFSAGMWFSAVYSGHHYVIDVAAGILCAVSGVALVETAFHRVGGLRRAHDALISALRA